MIFFFFFIWVGAGWFPSASKRAVFFSWSETPGIRCSIYWGRLRERKAKGHSWAARWLTWRDRWGAAKVEVEWLRLAASRPGFLPCCCSFCLQKWKRGSWQGALEDDGHVSGILLLAAAGQALGEPKFTSPYLEFGRWVHAHGHHMGTQMGVRHRGSDLLLFATPGVNTHAKE